MESSRRLKWGCQIFIVKVDDNILIDYKWVFIRKLLEELASRRFRDWVSCDIKHATLRITFKPLVCSMAPTQPYRCENIDFSSSLIVIAAMVITICAAAVQSLNDRYKPP